ncbi:hypothetical protein J416_11502 [Gracilibacillus halophilus YIM-C55.5]|uniref:CHY-type domain-containing protein n=1 Tax=Gracilibacillus halophilus YIM-C55.5 TaxID=1308866 RepID=N4WJG0_9BACI|nr:CHY zinc finger protein [Gracilibacillus halophilus]ENH96297.1 hypothetical protein J416_11502 [Gracilibacillus halophilus YIM-C55.5]
MNIHDFHVQGAMIDHHTRCAHYHSSTDIVAIKFRCCQTYYPCYQCHEEETNHSIRVWKKEEFDQKAILCGNCANELTINEYLGRDFCIYCQSAFNPNCQRHYHLYFEMT